MFDLTRKESTLLHRLNTPRKIQAWLDAIPFNFELNGLTYLSPRSVLRERQAHCLEGAVFAALALRLHGQRPLILDLESNGKDQDHVVTLFKQHGCWGAISKTNHASLRYREPVYRTVRELVLSYFHEYFNANGSKTLRRYSAPVDLSRFDRLRWAKNDSAVDAIAQHLCDIPHTELLTRGQIAGLRRVDAIELKAGEIVEWKRPGRR